eukprot:CAMPEP_0204869840 /NCGR_PEP_ID=MMETSP1348-20121228/30932_1 /ASSEMBLY_ACC=CAM_ASM_000700 /TAXON_ID=215587 /ORGANISM="Aplanochytrium stocchinoi, Strain GSBS06" /LENGTH=485 /DNA_ID=CAMNT_0052023365 /DNA_START=746 /DNA_END=2203 /DNA_ORIENTATION=-
MALSGQGGAGQGGMPFGHQDRDPSVDYLLQVISGVLEDLVSAGEHESSKHIMPKSAMDKSRFDKNRIRNNQVSKFNGLHPPSISILYYLQRIARFSGCSNECFVLMLIYIDRLVTRNCITLDQFNVHRLIISAILLSAKFFDDHFYFNPHFAVVGGLQSHEMNTLELEFLFLIEFNLYVTGEEYHKYYNTLAKMAISRFTPKSGLPPNLSLPQPLPQPMERLPLPPDPEFENVQLIHIDMRPKIQTTSRNQVQTYNVYTHQHKQQQHHVNACNNPHLQLQYQQQHMHVAPFNVNATAAPIYHNRQHHSHMQHHPQQQQQRAQQQQSQRYHSPPGQDQWVHVSPNTDTTIASNVDSSFTMVNDFYHTSPNAYIVPNNVTGNGFAPVAQIPVVYQEQGIHQGYTETQNMPHGYDMPKKVQVPSIPQNQNPNNLFVQNHAVQGGWNVGHTHNSQINGVMSMNPHENTADHRGNRNTDSNSSSAARTGA